MTAEHPTEGDVLTWLRRRYSEVSAGAPRYVFATHVRSVPGSGLLRVADALALACWRSDGYELHGHEVKVSRGDWLRELRDPGKTELVGRFCDRWWVVVPSPSIVRQGELPPGWGLLVATPTRVAAAVSAVKREAEPISRPFLAALLRATARTAAS